MIGAMFEINIKYDLLDSFLDSYLTNVKYSSNVNIIIDLKSVFKKCYRQDINHMLKDQSVVIEDITSTIINMVGFYRNYFYKKSKYTTFYILYSDKECEEMKKINNDYKRNYYNEMFIDGEDDSINNLHHEIKSSFKLSKIICDYIPHVSFINTSDFDEFVYTNFLIREYLNKNDLNILFSSDVVLYQALNKNTLAIDLKGINSNLITEKNVIEYLCKKDSVESGNLLTLLLSVSGVQSYSLNNIENYGYKKSNKLILDLMTKKYLIDNAYMNCPEEVIKLNSIMKDNLEMIKLNYKSLFPLELQMNNHEKILENITRSGFTQSATKEQFKELNDRKFIYYPLNINFILRGEKL